MGIPRLKGHLLRYEETVWLGDSTPNNGENTRKITSVVIDGPALVYHAYYSVLATMEQHLNPFSAQPSSDEVSTGVMKILLHLRNIGVTVEKIYFDGALPESKRETRIERMRKLASKLELACLAKERGFKSGTAQRSRARPDTEIFFSRRSMNPKFYDLPDNPLMVATVVEDLKYRWDWESIRLYNHGSIEGVSNLTERPWADITEVVLGEADIYCAETARERGSAVLTGDSDLLVHDLGPRGSVIFLDSIERYEVSGTKNGLLPLGLRATEMCPCKIAKQLGVKSLQRVGYELKRDPYMKLSMITELAKSDDEKKETSSSYIAFLNEYTSCAYRASEEDSKEFPLLDSKVSELVAQYYHPGFSPDGDVLYSYLPVMIEKHGRRCAWAEATDIRTIAYSIFNLSFLEGKRRVTVREHSRRGERIASTSVSLLSEEDLAPLAEDLLEQLNSLLSSVKDQELSSIPKHRAMKNFFKVGYAGEMLKWDDIHLRAQILCTLYSLRMLKQFLQVSSLSGGARVQRLRKQLLDVLSELPPLRILSDAGIGFSGTIESHDKDISHIINVMFERLGGDQHQEKNDRVQPEDDGQPYLSNNKKRKREKKGLNLPPAARQRPIPSRNMYDILQEE
ncbi:uncharacterized protein GIQ15_06344 [Arthroderma uncinatum]|uniref:uncharacterized protein n=1 Tax=Arthroderma uncinatum TaxID=74035 RepID=UPI00144A7528|nr:uncharacterized protein GIQ15_06344 [Arthroderma uncinatum]KAF3480997.1 hypothetical protein GIQ15_06344 [Arthroderma uncinatum]